MRNILKKSSIFILAYLNGIEIEKLIYDATSNYKIEFNFVNKVANV